MQPLKDLLESLKSLLQVNTLKLVCYDNTHNCVFDLIEKQNDLREPGSFNAKICIEGPAGNYFYATVIDTDKCAIITSLYIINSLFDYGDSGEIILDIFINVLKLLGVQAGIIDVTVKNSKFNGILIAKNFKRILDKNMNTIFYYINLDENAN